MKTTTILWKYAKYVLETVAALAVAYLLAAIVLSIIPVGAEKDTQNDVNIYLLGNGAHVDIIMPVNTPIINWADIFNQPYSDGQEVNQEYVSVGWGDREFYLSTPTWSDIKLSTALHAILGMGKSAFHISFYQSAPNTDNCIEISMSYEQYARLTEFILDDLKVDASGIAIPIETRDLYESNDTFYESDAKYSMFNTCNSWTNNAMKSCGQKACLWTPFQEGIFFHHK